MVTKDRVPHLPGLKLERMRFLPPGRRDDVCATDGWGVRSISERPRMNSPFWVKPKLLDSQSEALANLS